MFLIFGFRAVQKIIYSGVFFCPREGGDRNYEYKRARRFFTLFFIPLIPLNDLGDYVECSSCKGTYYADVLKAKTVGQIQDVATIAIRRISREARSPELPGGSLIRSVGIAPTVT